MTETLSTPQTAKTPSTTTRPMVQPQATDKNEPDKKRTGRPGIVLATVLAGQFMALLDASIVNVAIPTIHTSLHASGAGLQMVVAGYIIAYAVLLVTGARLGRLHGQGRMFMLGLSGFTVASLLCGIAPNTGTLIGFRVLQGISGAMMIPQVLSLIQATFVGEARAKAMSAWTAVLASGIVVGQVLGGVLVSANLFGWSWRPVFLVNVPIGIVLLIAASRSLPAKPQVDPANPHPRLDVRGVATLIPTLLALIVPLVLGHEENWPVWGWVALAAVVPLLGLFLAVERGVARKGGAPILPSRVLHLPGMKPSLGVLIPLLVVYSGNLFSTAIHLQTALGFSALRTGLAFAPSATAFGLVSYFWRRIPADKIRAVSIAGLFLAVVGIGLQVLIFRNGGSGGAWLYADQFLFGFGIGLGNAPTMTLALMKVPVEDASDASGVITSSSQLAQVIGIATLGTVYLTLLPHHTVNAAGHAMAVMSGVATVVTLVAVVFATRLMLTERNERRAAKAASAV